MYLSSICEELFADEPYIRKFPDLIVKAENYTFLVDQLSLCEKNVLFIHDRDAMMKVVKPKLPELVKSYRRKFKYLPFSQDLANTASTCFKYDGNLIQSVVKKYIEHGLYNTWVNFARMLSFRWNTGMKEELNVEKVITLDENFIHIIFPILIAQVFSIFILSAEVLYCRHMSCIEVIRKFRLSNFRKVLAWIKRSVKCRSKKILLSWRRVE